MEPYNGEGNCSSFGNGVVYSIPVNVDGINMLTKKENGAFTISELEVWEI